LRGIRIYVAVLVLGFIGLILSQFRTGDRIPLSEFLLFLALIAIAEARPVILPKVAVTVSFIIGVVAIIELPPAAVTLATGLGVVGIVLGGERRGWFKLGFNIVQMGLAGGLAAEAYRSIGPAVGANPFDHLPTVILATGVATGVFFVVNTVAVSGAIAIASKTPFFNTWLGNFSWLTTTYVAFGASGIVLAALYELVGVLALPLLLVPLLVARGVFRSYEEVSDAYESTVLAFVAAIEAKDFYTKGHSVRVTEYAMSIARRLGMTEEQLTAFRFGALLHDVGKLAVRKSILTKPSGLTDDEYEQIKLHPVLGAQIVQEIEFLRPALDGVLYHHERLDGSGYPAGLRGDIVPEWARIMAIADTFDAMTSTRAYRAARTPAEAIAELKRCAGETLDAKFVNMFLEALKDEDARKQFELRTHYEPKPISSPAV
jgi:putative nucleotidyltransferase with HDIG domain